jgi:hypothetical protein
VSTKSATVEQIANSRKVGPTKRTASKFEPGTFRTVPTMPTLGIETKDRSWFWWSFCVGEC